MSHLLARLLRYSIAVSLVLCTAGVPSAVHRSVASAAFNASATPYLPGSRIPISLSGMRSPYSLHILGDARTADDLLEIPSSAAPETLTVLAANASALAMRSIAITSPPSGAHGFIAVASYDDGVVLHRTAAPFAAFAVLGIGGAPSAVAIDSGGRIAAADTDSDALSIAHLQPWSVEHVVGVSSVDELAFDPSSHALFATDREVNGGGALTRVDASGSVLRAMTGETAEGIAIDAVRNLVYVANVNDGTVSVLDAKTMLTKQTFHVIARDFSLALSANGNRLYAVSNQSERSIIGAPGSVIAYAVHRGVPHVIARSGPLAFPVGIAYDPLDRRVFVTDERDDVVYVLDATTLRPLHAALRTCGIPWTPTFDTRTDRLYVPCARSASIDVFDGRTLARVAGAPFATGGYPLDVAIWHPTSH